MKITIVQGAFFPVPPVRGGGVEAVWNILGKIMAKQGHVVHHISRAVPELPEQEICDRVIHRRIQGFDQPRSLWRLKFYDLLYSLKVMKLLPASDVLVTNTFWMPLLPVPKYAGCICVHVARFPKYQHRFYQRASRFHAVSKTVGDAITMQAPCIAHKVRIIYNPLLDDIKSSEERKTDPPLKILYVGRIHPEKGIHILLQALVHLRQTVPMLDWHLKIVGPWKEYAGGGGDKYLQELNKISATVADRIQWCGPINERQRLKQEYAQADLFVYPSLAEKGEAMPLAPIEAMGQGCPVIVSDLSCLRELVRSNSEGWIFNRRVQDSDNTSLVKVLKNACESQSERLSKGQCGLDRIREFLPEKIAEHYINDFQQVLEEAS